MRELQALVAPKISQGVVVRGHAGLVINKLSHGRSTTSTRPGRDWYFIAEQPAPASHLARPEGRAALTNMC